MTMLEYIELALRAGIFAACLWFCALALAIIWDALKGNLRGITWHGFTALVTYGAFLFALNKIVPDMGVWARVVVWMGAWWAISWGMARLHEIISRWAE